MNEKRECVNCDFWFKHEKGNVGDCRRNPPIIVKENAAARFPYTPPNYWCGEYEPKSSDEPLPLPMRG